MGACEINEAFVKAGLGCTLSKISYADPKGKLKSIWCVMKTSGTLVPGVGARNLSYYTVAQWVMLVKQAIFAPPAMGAVKSSALATTWDPDELLPGVRQKRNLETLKALSIKREKLCADLVKIDQNMQAAISRLETWWEKRTDFAEFQGDT